MQSEIKTGNFTLKIFEVEDMEVGYWETNISGHYFREAYVCDREKLRFVSFLSSFYEDEACIFFMGISLVQFMELLNQNGIDTEKRYIIFGIEN